jgi:hypothetical protein
MFTSVTLSGNLNKALVAHRVVQNAQAMLDRAKRRHDSALSRLSDAERVTYDKRIGPPKADGRHGNAFRHGPVRDKIDRTKGAKKKK